eukprot:gb/GECH01004619.1/.p1 GENE.gb/GECH01004619.1/~~gb/GECH01004619.1/.p1  ORF type:complete len:232 (+),score=20.71 gb/GECH01004619.1/:1-696(+)
MSTYRVRFINSYCNCYFEDEYPPHLKDIVSPSEFHFVVNQCSKYYAIYKFRLKLGMSVACSLTGFFILGTISLVIIAIILHLTESERELSSNTFETLLILAIVFVAGSILSILSIYFVNKYCSKEYKRAKRKVRGFLSGENHQKFAQRGLQFKLKFSIRFSCNKNTRQRTNRRKLPYIEIQYNQPISKCNREANDRDTGNISDSDDSDTNDSHSHCNKRDWEKQRLLTYNT